jgi:hypothetical protein
MPQGVHALAELQGLSGRRREARVLVVLPSFHEPIPPLFPAHAPTALPVVAGGLSC